MTDSDYVTNASWVRTAGRPDAIDDVADQFERQAGAEAFWAGLGSGSVRTLGRRAAAPLRPQEGARLAG